MLIAPKNSQRYYGKHNNPQGKHVDESVPWPTWHIDVNCIPSLSMYYVLERSSITIKQTPIPLVESRVRNFFRLQSISYEFDAAEVRLHCVTPNMLKFVVQFWLVGGGPHETCLEDPNEALTVELQRRQGSAVEMDSIRRKMFKALTTGEQKVPERKPRQLSLPETIMTEVSSGYDQDEGLADAVEIALRLLESQCIDQRGLGLESLGMLTNVSVVSPRDAVIVSRAIVYREGRYGARLQASLDRFFGVSESNVEDEDTVRHSMALKLLANALEVVAEDAAKDGVAEKTVDDTENSSFWKHVSSDLLRNVERAVFDPHVAASSAKIIYLIRSRLGETNLGGVALAPLAKGPAWRSCLAHAHSYGQFCHLSLERESRMLLTLDTQRSL